MQRKAQAAKTAQASQNKPKQPNESQDKQQSQLKSPQNPFQTHPKTSKNRNVFFEVFIVSLGLKFY